MSFFFIAAHATALRADVTLTRTCTASPFELSERGQIVGATLFDRVPVVLCPAGASFSISTRMNWFLAVSVTFVRSFT
jgi:hypothetical protein